jgi:hypothetical protein
VRRDLAGTAEVDGHEADVALACWRHHVSF